MKRFNIAIIICLASISLLQAQSNVTLYFAQNYARFKYNNSQDDNNLDLNTDIRYCYGFNYNKIFENGLFARPELGYKNMGATSYTDNEKMNWSLNYLDFNVGGGYMVNTGKLRPYIGASFYVAYLYKAEQSMGNFVYNLRTSGDIKKTDFGLNVYGGLLFNFSDNAGVFFEIRNSTGLNQLETTVETEQELYNRSFSFHLGLSLNIN